MPTPKKDESEKDFVSRCIPIVIAEGTAKDGSQGAAICHSMYQEWKKKESKAMEPEIERRCFPVAELRAEGDEKGIRHITGYAAVFNSLSEKMMGFQEKINPGAFASTLRADDIRALWNHDPNYVLGRNKSGTLTLSEDQRGLKFDCIPPDTQWARDYIASIERGDVDQMSFGFKVPKGGERWEGTYPNEIRTLLEVKLFDVSPVTFAAYPNTEVALRSLEEYRKEHEGNKADEHHLIGLKIKRRRLKLKEISREE